MVVGLLVVGIGLVAVGSLHYSPDEAPPDTSELNTPPIKDGTLADDQNAYALLKKAVALLKPELIAPTFRDPTDPLDLPSGNETHAATEAGKWLDGTDAIWPIWEEASLASGSQVMGENLSSNRSVSRGIGVLRELANIRAWMLVAKGQDDEAVRTQLTHLRVDWWLEETRSDREMRLMTRVGSREKNEALQALRALAMQPGTTQDELHRALASLEGLRPTKATALIGMHNAYQTLEETFDRFEHTNIFYDGNDESSPEALTPNWFQRLLMSHELTFKPNRTRRLYLEGMRSAIVAIDLDMGQLSARRQTWLNSDMVKLPDPSFEKNLRNTFRNNGMDNIFGRMALHVTDPFDGFFENRLEEQTNISATQAFIALLLYDREHEALPPTLDELVPAYLPAVPRDYYAGKPIHYSKESRLVWATEDTLNDSGAAPEANSDDNIVYIPLDFATPRTTVTGKPGSAVGPPASK